MVSAEVRRRANVVHAELLEQVRHEAISRLWYLDKPVWSRKGSVSRRISETIRILASPGALCATSDNSSEWTEPLRECALRWAETGLNWSDLAVLFEVIESILIPALVDEDNDSDLWRIRAISAALQAQIAGKCIRAQAEEVADQRDQGVTTQHMAGRFLANASHQLRTPLTAVLGFSELLLEETYGQLNAGQRTAVEYVENSAQNLLEIINNVLDLMQFRAGRLQLQYRRIAAAALLEDICSILQPLAVRKKVRFRSEISPDLGSADTDEGIVRHIVYNLLESALRATPENGEVVLKAERTDRFIVVSTFDTALHFPPDAIENMNDLFPIRENSRARGYDGWEIGLPLVRRYVELLTGSLEIESSEEQGTTIRVKLPVSRPVPTRSAAHSDSTASE